MDFAATFMGNALSAPVFVRLGATWTFLIGALLTFLGLPYIVFILRESVVAHKKDSTEDDQGLLALIKKAVLFTLEGFKALLKPREGWRRGFILIIYLVYTLHMFANIGAEGGHKMYYAKKKYDYKEPELTVHYTFNRVASMIGLLMLVPLLTRGLKLSDISLGILSAGVSAVGYFLPVFTGSQSWFRAGSYVLDWFSFSSYLLALSPVLFLTCRYILHHCTCL